MGTFVRGNRSQAARAGLLAGLVLAVSGLPAAADPVASPTAVTPDAPARSAPPASPIAPLPDSADLDGLYLWLGPTGAATRTAGQWDSTIGGAATVIQIREQAEIGAVGGSLGATRWTARGGGRIWLDALVGTRIAGRMVGLSAGPLVELAELAHPRVGGSVGLWGFVGVTPFVRVGAVTELGGFVEVGIHIALPVLRRR